MKRLLAVVLLLLTLFGGMAQVPVQTLVPKQAIAVGQSFQVQYVVTDLYQFEGLQTPQFGPDFKEVSGPVMYNATITSNGKKVAVHNYSFTLVPLRKGKLPIAGATAIYAHKKEASAPAFITTVEGAPRAGLAGLAQVLPQEEEAPEQIALPLLKVQASVDRRECFVGEPIVATFTLISNIVAGAEVVKNPGFYGFSVVEMPRGRIQLTEMDMAAGYEKHLLRKVQLYPMQAGTLVIDEMTVYNIAEWPDAATGRTSEKEILLNSAPISIVVKPLPPSPVDTFTGAVGKFNLQAQLKQTSFKAGQTGKLQVTLSGAGNFLQLPIPEVAWPNGIEGFEPKVEEDLQKEVVPERGEKEFLFSFTTDSAGHYTIPPIRLTYFNPQTKKYETASTESLQFTVTGQKGPKAFLTQPKKEKAAPVNGWIIAAIAGGVLLPSAIWLVVKRKRKSSQPPVQTTPPANTVSYTEQLRKLQPAQKDLKTFYGELQQIVYGFLKAHYGITATGSSPILQQINSAPFSDEQKKELQLIIEECESVQYYNATPSLSFNALQLKAIAVVGSLEK